MTIDWHAVILRKLDEKHGLVEPNLTFMEELQLAMERPLDGETPFEELERRYPNWRDEINVSTE